MGARPASRSLFGKCANRATMQAKITKRRHVPVRHAPSAHATTTQAWQRCMRTNQALAPRSAEANCTWRNPVPGASKNRNLHCQASHASCKRCSRAGTSCPCHIDAHVAGGIGSASEEHGGVSRRHERAGQRAQTKEHHVRPRATVEPRHRQAREPKSVGAMQGSCAEELVARAKQ